MKIFLGSLILFIGICTKVTAQHYLGVATDGWGSMNTLYLNPANIAGREEKVSINLMSLNLSADNNQEKLNKTGNIFGPLGGSNYTGVFGNSTAHLNSLIPSGEVRGPGVMVSLNPENALALTTGIRAINQLNNFDPSLYAAITHSGSLPNTSFSTQAHNFNWTAQMWSQVGLTYATVIDRGTSQWNAGVTLRYLGGIGFLAVKGYNLNVDYKAGQDSFFASQSELQYASNVQGSSGAISNGINTSDLLNKFFGAKAGSGGGGDIGVTYFWRPVHNLNNDAQSGNGYKLRVSASVTDLGIIYYKAANNTMVDVRGSGYLTGGGLIANTRSTASFTNYARQQGFRTDSVTDNTQLLLPATAVFSADLQVYQRFYINATYMGNIMDRLQYGNSFYDQYSLIPRYDSREVSVGLPITYSKLSNEVKIGIGIRYTGFFIGSDDLLGLAGSAHGFGFYLGGYIPLYKTKGVIKGPTKNSETRLPPGSE